MVYRREKAPRLSHMKKGASPPDAPPLGSAGVHAEVVGYLGDGSAVSGDRLHPRPRPAGVGPARRAAARRGPRVGRRRTGTVALGLSPGPEPGSGPKGSFSVGFNS